MSLVFTTSGSNGNNTITKTTGGSPFKPSTMSQGSMLSNALMVYSVRVEVAKIGMIQVIILRSVDVWP